MNKKQLFTSTNLPAFKDGTDGHMKPAPGAPVAVCIAPADATIKRPKGWGAGQALKIKKGDKHIAQDGVGDSYPNQEYDTFYQTGDVLDPTDPRAAFLLGFWCGAAPEETVEIRLGQKVRPAICLGEIVDEAVGSTFENHEGTTELVAGTRILQSPDDESIRWAVTPKVYGKKYAEGGKVYPGKPDNK